MTVDKHKMLRTPNESIADLEHRVWQLEREQHHCRNIPTKVEPDIVLDAPPPPPPPPPANDTIHGVWVVDETNGEIYPATISGDKPSNIFPVPGIKAMGRIAWGETNIFPTATGPALITIRAGWVKTLPIPEPPGIHFAQDLYGQGTWVAFRKGDNSRTASIVWYSYENPEQPVKIGEMRPPEEGFTTPYGDIITFDEKNQVVVNRFDVHKRTWEKLSPEGYNPSPQDERGLLKNDVVWVIDKEITWFTNKGAPPGTVPTQGWDLLSDTGYRIRPLDQRINGNEVATAFPHALLPGGAVVYTQGWVLPYHTEKEAVKFHKALRPDGYEFKSFEDNKAGIEGTLGNGRDGYVLNTYRFGNKTVNRWVDLNKIRPKTSNKYSLIVVTGAVSAGWEEVPTP